MEKCKPVISASGCGVTSPLNCASNASGIGGGGVEDGGGGADGVSVLLICVGVRVGVLTGLGFCVFLANAVGVLALNIETSNRLGFLISENTIRTIPLMMKTARDEKAICARALFFWREI